MSFQFGVANWLVLATSGIVFAYLFLKKKIKGNFLLFLGIFSVIFSIFLAIKPSIFLWNAFAKLFAIDFPWKFLGPAVFWSGFLFALVIQKIRSWLKYPLAFLLLFLIFYANRNHIHINEYTSFDIPSAVFYEKSTNTEDEYLPKWVSGFNFGDSKNMNIKLSDRVQVESSGRISGVRDQNQNFSFTYSGPKTNVVIKKIYFPGWSVTKGDNQKINFTFGNGFFNFKLPEGKTDIKIAYEGTELVKISTLVSFFAWILISIYLLFLALIYVKNKKFTQK